MIPAGAYNVRLHKQFYRDGYIVTEYIVLIPDRTISGDFRYEFAVTKVEAPQR